MGREAKRILGIITVLSVILVACSGEPTVVRVTLNPTQDNVPAPVYSPTASSTPTVTVTATSSPTITTTFTPTATFTETYTPTATFTATFTPTNTDTPTATFTPTATATHTPPPSPTSELIQLTAPPRNNVSSATILPAKLTEPLGWSCVDFPCSDDVDGWLQRIQVPNGFNLSHVGQFPGHVQQIVYGRDGALYATVLEDGTQNGAVYRMMNGIPQRYSNTFVSPLGLAFQPETDILYVSGRITIVGDGGLWQVNPDGTRTLIIGDLPCCYDVVGNQPNGMVFGQDGYLYMGIGALTDHGESTDPSSRQYDVIHPLEAGILRIQPHTGDVERFASGIRNPFDLTFDSAGQFYATDNGIAEGQGDRLLAIQQGGFYRFPYYRTLGCPECPPLPPNTDVLPDLVTFPDYTLPRGLVAYTGSQFPSNMFNTLFVTLWNAIEGGQRVVWIEPRSDALLGDGYEPQAFVTGLVRPMDVIIAPDGSLVIADGIHGHIWQVSYGDSTVSQPTDENTETNTSPLNIFATNTPNPE